MKNYNDVRTFNEFWPLYLRAHSSRTSRALHLLGIALSAASAAVLLAHGLIFFIALAAVPAMIGAWLGHRLSPRSEWVLDEERPDWAARADLKMFVLAITGRLGGELEKVARPAAAVPSKPAWSL